MNDTDVQAPNTDCKPKLHKNYKLVLQIWLVNHNVVPGSTKMLIQEHVALGKIRFCHCIIYSKKNNINWHSQNSLHDTSHLMFFHCFYLVFSYQLCTLGFIWHLMSLKLLFIALFYNHACYHNGVLYLCEGHCAPSVPQILSTELKSDNIPYSHQPKRSFFVCNLELSTKWLNVFYD